MRALIAATLILSCAADRASADEQLSASLLQQLTEAEDSLFLRYERESLTTSLELALGRGRINFSIANALELPEYEPRVFLDESVLLTDSLNGFEVDTGTERMFSLVFSFGW